MVDDVFEPQGQVGEQPVAGSWADGQGAGGPGAQASVQVAEDVVGMGQPVLVDEDDRVARTLLMGGQKGARRDVTAGDERAPEDEEVDDRVVAGQPGSECSGWQSYGPDELAAACDQFAGAVVGGIHDLAGGQVMQ